ncbi:hypothetical protein SISNIDRAFT_471879, partial [Sistotremastrum niveocremeum HHB9708]
HGSLLQAKTIEKRGSSSGTPFRPQLLYTVAHAATALQMDSQHVYGPAWKEGLTFGTKVSNPYGDSESTNVWSSSKSPAKHSRVDPSSPDAYWMPSRSAEDPENPYPVIFLLSAIRDRTLNCVAFYLAAVAVLSRLVTGFLHRDNAGLTV